MISHIPQIASDWLVKLSLVTVMGLPPKDPDDDDDENEEDEQDDMRSKKNPSHQRTGRIVQEPSLLTSSRLIERHDGDRKAAQGGHARPEDD